jgi:hypothetical protein
VTCGQLGAPECPLQAWMDNRLNVALSTANYLEVARSMRELAADRPEAFATWATWAEEGAAAADRQDELAIRRACSGCHDDTREAYRLTMRDRPVPAAPLPAPAATSATETLASPSGSERRPASVGERRMPRSSRAP